MHTDNKGILFAINLLSSKSEFVIKLLSLVLHGKRYNIWLKVKHIPAVHNKVADALSRSQFTKFRELAPDADLVGTPCQDFLWGLNRDQFSSEYFSRCFIFS